jgi:hypothetical protein
LRQQFHDQVWLFHVAPESAELNLFEQQEVCTHNLPNRVQIIGRDYQFSLAEEDVWSVLVRSDFSAEGRLCKKGNMTQCDRAGVAGHWQTIYDQTLIVELDNDLRFIGTFRYQLKTNVTKDAKKLSKALTEVDDFMKAQFNSVCNQTMAGFVQNKSHASTYQKHRVQCMYATKDWNELYEKQVGGIEVQKSSTSVDSSILLSTSAQKAKDVTLIATAQGQKAAAHQ